ncbi:MAG: glycosyltransferase family 4 protein [Acidimicrobiia bacterium]
MKLAFVTPRYGAEVIGGAELGARLLAEHAVQLLGWPVEVYTTTALESTTWANHYRQGTTVENGVTVHRFDSKAGRSADFDKVSAIVLPPRIGRVPDEEENRWIEAQGPVCPAAIDAVEASDADIVAFYPYLYHPTVAGLPRLRERAVMHPAAHDERPIYLRAFREPFAAARGLVFHTDGERRLVERIFRSVLPKPQIVLGLGSDPGEGDAVAARNVVGDRPYLVCVGRVDEGKGCTTLARFFIEYKQRHPGPLALVFVGPVIHQPPAHPDIIVAGRIDEATKWGLLRGADLFVSPSGFESFSFVLLEAWSAGLPALVNSRCDATREHCETCGGGLWFDDYPTFEVCVDKILGDRVLAQAMAAAGNAYVEDNYRWPAVMARYGAFLERLVSHG